MIFILIGKFLKSNMNHFKNKNNHCCVYFLAAQQITKNQGFFRTKSKEGKTPSLPREGAQHMARQINMAHTNRNQDFMSPPDAGVAGYVDTNLYLLY